MWCDCDRCAAWSGCPDAKKGEYGRRCWDALAAEKDAPDCEDFVEPVNAGHEWKCFGARVVRGRY